MTRHSNAVPAAARFYAFVRRAPFSSTRDCADWFACMRQWPRPARRASLRHSLGELFSSGIGCQISARRFGACADLFAATASVAAPTYPDRHRARAGSARRSRAWWRRCVAHHGSRGVVAGGPSGRCAQIYVVGVFGGGGRVRCLPNVARLRGRREREGPIRRWHVYAEPLVERNRQLRTERDGVVDLDLRIELGVLPENTHFHFLNRPLGLRGAERQYRSEHRCLDHQFVHAVRQSATTEVRSRAPDRPEQDDRHTLAAQGKLCRV